jgi:hypothetical protein
MKVSRQTLFRLQSVQADTMDDRCNIIHVSLSSGTYGNSLETRTLFMSNVPCGIEFTGGKIVQRGEMQFVDYDCLLRIADDIPVQMNDEIALIEKGEFLISGTFKPYSAPVVNSSVQKIQLKRQAP